MSSLDELLYKEKYLKYKNKYIQLKEYQGGGLKDVFNKTRKVAITVANTVATKAYEAKTVANTVATKASEAKTKVNEKIYLKAYIIAKTEVIQNLKNEIDNKTIKKNISAIEDFLKLKGYIIYSNDSKKIKLIGAKGTLSNLGDSANDLVDYMLGNKTLKGQIKEISNYIDKINNVINFITNNESVKQILKQDLGGSGDTGDGGNDGGSGDGGNDGGSGDTGEKGVAGEKGDGDTGEKGVAGEKGDGGNDGDDGNDDGNNVTNSQCNTIKCYIDKIIESEKLNMDHVNKIKQMINNIDKVLLNRKVSTYNNIDEINNTNNKIFDATYTKNKIDDIKNLVYNELIKKSSENNTYEPKKISHIYIEYTNVPKSNANITFYIIKT